MPELKLSVGQRVLFWDPEVSDTAHTPEPVALIPLPGLVELLPKLRPQHRMWFCDGRLSFVVEELQPAALVAWLEKGAIPLKSSNALFLPDSQNPFSVFTCLDRELLTALAAAKLRPDWVALSLIGSPAEQVASGGESQRIRLASQIGSGRCAYRSERNPQPPGGRRPGHGQVRNGRRGRFGRRDH